MRVHRHRPYNKLQSLPVSKRPWQELSMDFITGLPPSKRRGVVYNAILIIVDRYTKIVRYLLAKKDLDAATLAELFFEEIICRYSIFNSIINDRDTIFTSAF